MAQLAQVAIVPELDDTLVTVSLNYSSSAITRREQAERQSPIDLFNDRRAAKYFLDLLLKPSFDEAAEKLKNMEKLQPNWNSYGAEPPTKETRDRAAQVLIELRRLSYLPTRIVPSSEGGIAICFIKDQRYADIECLNSGEILAVTYAGTSEPDVWEVKDGMFEKAIEQIREHVTP